MTATSTPETKRSSGNTSNSRPSSLNQHISLLGHKRAEMTVAHNLLLPIRPT